MMPTILKVFSALGLAIAALLLAGIFGLYFSIWPTGLNDHSLAVTPRVLERLNDLKRERKFEADPANFYPGAMDETSRAESQERIDAVIESLISELPSSPRKSVVLRTFKTALARYKTPESEDRDQFVAYLERIMQIVGVRESDELFNVWRYGFPYGWLSRD